MRQLIQQRKLPADPQLDWVKGNQLPMIHKINSSWSATSTLEQQVIIMNQLGKGGITISQRVNRRWKVLKRNEEYSQILEREKRKALERRSVMRMVSRTERINNTPSRVLLSKRETDIGRWSSARAGTTPPHTRDKSFFATHRYHGKVSAQLLLLIIKLSSQLKDETKLCKGTPLSWF